MAGLCNQLAHGILMRLAAVTVVVVGSDTRGAKPLDILFMADIGHSREHANTLTTPSVVMGRSAFEGAFSLYDGLFDLVVNQGVRPEAVIIAGDVGYVGGSAGGLNETRRDFQKYLAGVVPSHKVFPVIGNHDVNYLGCMFPSLMNPFHPTCYYGQHHHALAPAADLSYDEWRGNWFWSFPGLKSAISPGNSTPGRRADWAAPLRYNLDLHTESSVYFIMGLISGSKVTAWGPGTPHSALDGYASGGDAVECAFLSDSLVHGRSKGKTIFVYVTHDFKPACNDWSLIKQVDIWIYGHVHNAWQSTPAGSTLIQEQQHYPARILIGNGGFDNGLIDVVSFGRIREEVLPGAGADGEDRVRLTISMYDTCVSSKSSCPTTDMLPADYSCWQRCQDFPGGHDSGGGPRKATPTKHDLGFTFEAPRWPHVKPAPMAQAPFGQRAWTIQILDKHEHAGWVGFTRCGTAMLFRNMCLVLHESKEDAESFAFYDQSIENATEDLSTSSRVSARIAVADAGRGPVKAYGDALYEAAGFWDVSISGLGKMRPSDGLRFLFRQTTDQDMVLDEGRFKQKWAIENVVLEGGHLKVKTGQSLMVSFHPWPVPEMVQVV